MLPAQIKEKLDGILLLDDRDNYDTVQAMQESVLDEFDDDELEYAYEIQELIEGWWESQ